MVNKRIAIALATYNSSQYIKEQLDSLLNQTYQQFICYIHDDGSTDNTLDILKSYVIKSPGKFVLLDYPPLGSAKKNFMSIIKYVNEDYLMFCDHDDIWLPEKIRMSLETIIKIECSNPGRGILVFSDLCVVDKDLNVIWESFFRHKKYNPVEGAEFNRQLLLGCGAGCTMIMNRKVYDRAAQIRNPDNIIMHDYWCSLVASADGIVEYLDKPLLLYRQHGDNVWGVKEQRSFKQKVFDLLKDFYTLTYKGFIKKQKKWIIDPRIQAGEMIYINGIPEEKKKICGEYCELAKQNKAKRIRFYLRHNIKRDYNNIWLYFWC